MTPLNNLNMSLTHHSNRQACCQPNSSHFPPVLGTPLSTSSNGLVAWTNSLLHQGALQNIQEYWMPRGEVLSRPNQQLANLMNRTPYPTPSVVWGGSLSSVQGWLLLFRCWESSCSMKICPSHSGHGGIFRGGICWEYVLIRSDFPTIFQWWILLDCLQ